MTTCRDTISVRKTFGREQLEQRYRALAATLSPSVIFGGRLAEYKYYDMAPIIEKVMGMWE